jgi:hypothetical protein
MRLRRQAGEARISKSLPQLAHSGVRLVVEIHLYRISHPSTMPDKPGSVLPQVTGIPAARRRLWQAGPRAPAAIASESSRTPTGWPTAAISAGRYADSAAIEPSTGTANAAMRRFGSAGLRGEPEAEADKHAAGECSQ